MKKLIPLVELGSSFSEKVNFLYQYDNLYIMDNHRLAAWCWAQKVDKNLKYKVVHIDKHCDALGNQMESWLKEIKKDLKDLSLQEYLDLKFQKGNDDFKVFNWTNYIPLFYHFYKENIWDFDFYVHQGIPCSIPENLQSKITKCSFFNLINDFPENVLEDFEYFIVNLDIDYFFTDRDDYFEIMSPKTIEHIISAIMNFSKNKNNIVTIAISPECCGGWKNSLDFCHRYLKKYGIDIKLNPAANPV